jgi:hypothetical protein
MLGPKKAAIEQSLCLGSARAKQQRIEGAYCCLKAVVEVHQ